MNTFNNRNSITPSHSTSSSSSSSVLNDTPNGLNIQQRGQFLKIDRDLVTVYYVGPGTQRFDVGQSIQSDKPMNKKTLISYFEVEIKKASRPSTRSQIGIGLSKDKFRLNRFPGFDAKSLGYFGYDGGKYGFESYDGSTYADPFGEGDIIGCGLNRYKNEVFFTKNGKNLGTAFSNIPIYGWFPTVGLHSQGDRVTFNFGQKPFKFDLDEMKKLQEAEINLSVDKINLDIGDVNQLVQSYLKHSGYIKTLNKYHTSTLEDYACDTKRNELMELISKGEIQAALEYVKTHFTHVCKSNNRIELLLHCQHFIELIRYDNVDAAVEYAQDIFPEYCKSDLSLHLDGYSSSSYSMSIKGGDAIQKGSSDALAQGEIQHPLQADKHISNRDNHAENSISRSGNRIHQRLSNAPEQRFEFSAFISEDDDEEEVEDNNENYQEDDDEEEDDEESSLLNRSGYHNIEDEDEDEETFSDEMIGSTDQSNVFPEEECNLKRCSSREHVENTLSLRSSNSSLQKENYYQLDVQKLIIDALGLLAYESVSDAPQKSIIEENHRIIIADEVNKMIMDHFKKDTVSPLEQLIKQLQLSQECLPFETPSLFEM